MQIRIIKSDGNLEPYLHTKVLGAMNHALSLAGDECLYAAEQMAEAVTYYLYRKVQRGTLATDEIHLMILSVLSSTGYGHAAEALTQHRIERRLKRKRLEVVADHADDEGYKHTTHWDKTRIVADLMEKHNFDRLLSRAIAAAVEEKVLCMPITKIRKSLIHHLVVIDTESMLDAHRQLTSVGSA
jgi:hypothetical protein